MFLQLLSVCVWCVCVCVCVCMGVCMYIWLSEWLNVCVCVCVWGSVILCVAYQGQCLDFKSSLTGINQNNMCEFYLLYIIHLRNSTHPGQWISLDGSLPLHPREWERSWDGKSPRCTLAIPVKCENMSLVAAAKTVSSWIWQFHKYLAKYGLSPEWPTTILLNGVIQVFIWKLITVVFWRFVIVTQRGHLLFFFFFFFFKQTMTDVDVDESIRLISDCYYVHKLFYCFLPHQVSWTVPCAQDSFGWIRLEILLWCKVECLVLWWFKAFSLHR